MSEDVEVDGDSEPAPKRRPGLLKKIATWAGSVSAIVALMSQVMPHVYRWAIGDDLAECKADTEELNQIAKAAIQASQDRFSANEKVDIELRGAIESLRNEVRVRYEMSNHAARASVGSGAGLGAGAGYGSGAGRLGGSARRPEAPGEKLKKLTAETDRLLSKSMPEPAEPLMQTVEKIVEASPTSEPVP